LKEDLSENQLEQLNMMQRQKLKYKLENPKEVQTDFELMEKYFLEVMREPAHIPEMQPVSLSVETVDPDPQSKPKFNQVKYLVRQI
jgi:hypothetical protein